MSHDTCQLIHTFSRYNRTRINTNQATWRSKSIDIWIIDNDYRKWRLLTRLRIESPRHLLNRLFNPRVMFHFCLTIDSL